MGDARPQSELRKCPAVREGTAEDEHVVGGSYKRVGKWEQKESEFETKSDR